MEQPNKISTVGNIWIIKEGKEERIFKRDSNFLFIWNILVLYAYIFNIFEIPIAIFFTEAVYNDEFNVLIAILRPSQGYF